MRKKEVLAKLGFNDSNDYNTHVWSTLTNVPPHLLEREFDPTNESRILDPDSAIHWVHRFGPCSGAIEWMWDLSFEEAYRTLCNVDWMEWFLDQAGLLSIVNSRLRERYEVTCQCSEYMIDTYGESETLNMIRDVMPFEEVQAACQQGETKLDNT